MEQYASRKTYTPSTEREVQALQNEKLPDTVLQPLQTVFPDHIIAIQPERNAHTLVVSVANGDNMDWLFAITRAEPHRVLSVTSTHEIPEARLESAPELTVDTLRTLIQH